MNKKSKTDDLVRGAIGGVANTVKSGLDVVFKPSEKYEKVGGKDSNLYVKKK
jgi:hypothetical protein